MSTALVLALSACAGSVDGPVIEGSRSLGGSDALISGVLEYEGGCLYIEHPDADERYPIVWPLGTSWNEAESAVRLGDGTLVYVGDTVSGGGGFPSVSKLGGHTSSEGQELAQESIDNTYSEVAVFNTSEDIDVRRSA